MLQEQHHPRQSWRCSTPPPAGGPPLHALPQHPPGAAPSAATPSASSCRRRPFLHVGETKPGASPHGPDQAHPCPRHRALLAQLWLTAPHAGHSPQTSCLPSAPPPSLAAFTRRLQSSTRRESKKCPAATFPSARTALLAAPPAAGMRGREVEGC
jgi:hypothetical protein